MIGHIKSIIAQLLTSDLDNWGTLIIKGYHFKGSDEELPPPLLDEIIEFTTKGYARTKQDLKDWYNACQICQARTPLDESGNESDETIASIVSMRGGRYKGQFDEYSPGNSIFLCPNHQKLFERGLVKIPFLEATLNSEEKEKLIDSKRRVDEAIAKLKNKTGRKDEILDLWEVFGVPEKTTTSTKKWDYVQKEVLFRPAHQLALLDWMSAYIEGIINEQG